MSGRLQNRIALVTGASRGIGRAVAQSLAAEGAEVVCVARTQGALEELDDAIAAHGGKAVLVPEDLTRPGSIETIAKALAQRFGRLDILVGNAGTLGGELTPVGTGGAQFLERIFALNVTANWRLIDAMTPLLRQSDGARAVFLTDSMARTHTPFWSAYAASKAALESLVLTWAAEIGTITKIKVNLAAPVPTATRLRRQAFPGENPATIAQPEMIAQGLLPLTFADCPHHGQIVPVGLN